MPAAEDFKPRHLTWVLFVRATGRLRSSAVLAGVSDAIIAGRNREFIGCSPGYVPPAATQLAGCEPRWLSSPAIPTWSSHSCGPSAQWNAPSAPRPTRIARIMLLPMRRRLDANEITDRATHQLPRSSSRTRR